MRKAGLVTFPSTYWAVKGEKTLDKEGIPGKLVPIPRRLSSSCGLCLRFPLHEEARVSLLFKQAGVDFEQIVGWEF